MTHVFSSGSSLPSSLPTGKNGTPNILEICMHASIHTHTHTCMHAYIHTYLTLPYLTLQYITLHYITLHIYVYVYVYYIYIYTYNMFYMIHPIFGSSSWRSFCCNNICKLVNANPRVIPPGSFHWGGIILATNCR